MALRLVPLVMHDPQAQTRANIEQQLRNCMALPQFRERGPASYIAYLLANYAATTAVRYGRIARSLIEFKTPEESRSYQLALKAAAQHLAEFKRAHPIGAKPATVEQIKLLIGDLSTPPQRTVLQLFVLAARSREMIHAARPQRRLSWRKEDATSSDTDSDTSSEDSNELQETRWIPPLERASDVIFHTLDRQRPCVQFLLTSHKSATTGMRPYSRWVRMPSDPLRQRHWKAVWSPQRVPYKTLLNYIKSVCPDLSTHSFRKSAARFLKNTGSQAREVAAMTGHTETNAFRMLATTYTIDAPMQPEAIAVMDTTSRLLAAIGIDSSRWWTA